MPSPGKPSSPGPFRDELGRSQFIMMGRMKTKPWFEVLKAARRVNERGEPLTSGSLAKETGLQTNIASAWLFKFEKWNYVVRGQKEKTNRRWSWSWVLTRWGLRYKASSRAKKAVLRIAANPSEKKG